MGPPQTTNKTNSRYEILKLGGIILDENSKKLSIPNWCWEFVYEPTLTPFKYTNVNDEKEYFKFSLSRGELVDKNYYHHLSSRSKIPENFRHDFSKYTIPKHHKTFIKLTEDDDISSPKESVNIFSYILPFKLTDFHKPYKYTYSHVVHNARYMHIASNDHITWQQAKSEYPNTLSATFPENGDNFVTNFSNDDIGLYDILYINYMCHTNRFEKGKTYSKMLGTYVSSNLETDIDNKNNQNSYAFINFDFPPITYKNTALNNIILSLDIYIVLIIQSFMLKRLENIGIEKCITFY